MKLTTRHFSFLLVSAVAVLVYFSPLAAHAACSIDITGSVSPQIAKVQKFPTDGRFTDANPIKPGSPVKLDISWNATDDCNAPFTVRTRGYAGQVAKFSDSQSFTLTAPDVLIQSLLEKGMQVSGPGSKTLVSPGWYVNDGPGYPAPGYPDPTLASSHGNMPEFLVQPDIIYGAFDASNGSSPEGPGAITTTVTDACGYTRTYTIPVCSIFENEDGKRCGDLSPHMSPMAIGKSDSPISNVYWIRDISVGLDPEYVEIKKDQDKYTPTLPASPLDSIETRIQVKGCPLTRSTTLRASLVAIDSQKNQTELSKESVPLTLVSIPKDGDKPVYVFKAVFFPGFNHQDEIASAISDKDYIGVKIFETNNPTHSLSHELAMTNCAQVHGSGPRKVVTMQGNSIDRDEATLYRKALNWQGFFLNTEPFKTESDKFSFYIDFDLKTELGTTIGGAYTDRFPSELSSCEFAAIYGLMVKEIEKPDKEGKTVGLADFNQHFLLTSDASSDTFTHESGHAFAHLSDEHPGDSKDVKTQREPLSTNCSYDPDTDFSYNGKKYGSKLAGCDHVLSFSSKKLYRSSDKSLMNYFQFQTNSFNTVSCAFVLHAIRGGDDVKSLYPECQKLVGNI